MTNVRIITFSKNAEITQIVAKLEELLNYNFEIKFATVCGETLVYTLVRTQP